MPGRRKATPEPFGIFEATLSSARDGGGGQGVAQFINPAHQHIVRTRPVRYGVMLREHGAFMANLK